MVPFGRNPKSALSEQRSSDQQMGGEQQDECRPRRAGEMNGSVHCLILFFMLLLMFYSDIICNFVAANPNMLGL